MEKGDTTISRYFQFTEIRTKITSLFSFFNINTVCYV